MEREHIASLEARSRNVCEKGMGTRAIARLADIENFETIPPRPAHCRENISLQEFSPRCSCVTVFTLCRRSGKTAWGPKSKVWFGSPGCFPLLRQRVETVTQEQCGKNSLQRYVFPIVRGFGGVGGWFRSFLCQPTALRPVCPCPSRKRFGNILPMMLYVLAP
jgi:hypothetical protein